MQEVNVPVQVAQLGSQTLHIRLSETSPNSLVFVQAPSHVLVTFVPQDGLGQDKTQVDPVRYNGALQLVQ